MNRSRIAGYVAPRGRAAALFQESRNDIARRTDRMFARLMIFQWLAGIAAALWISPRTWIGSASQVHAHVWAAIFLGGAIASLPVLLAWRQPGQPLTRHVIAAAQMLTSALLIHLTGGRIETHFHVFGSLAFLAFYRDGKVLITATLVIAVDHMARGLFWPQSVFGVLSTSSWRWLEHAGWVIFEDAFLLISIRHSLKEMCEVATRRANLEEINLSIERQVTERTAELVKESAERNRNQGQLEAVIEAMQDGVMVFDMEGHAVLVNEAEARINGFANADEMRHNVEFFAKVYELTDLDGRIVPVEQWPVSKVLRGESVSGWELRGKRRDTGRKWVFSFGGAPVRDAQGKQILAVVVTRDITESKQAEERLNELLRSLEAVNSVLDRACIIARTDSRGAITHANDNFCRISGYSREELIGQNHRLLKSEQHSDAFLTELWRSIAVERRIWRGQIQNRAKDGSTYWVDTTIGPMLDDQGKPQGYLAIQFDITSQKLGQKQMADSEHRLRSILESEPECVTLVAADGALMDVNPAGLRMIEADDLSQVRGPSVYSLLAPEYHEIFRELNAAIFRGESKTAEFEIIGLKGTRRWMESHACPLRDSDGRISAQLSVTRDITSRKRAESELAKAHIDLVDASRRAGMAEVATGVLHNVGNVLNSINVASSCLAESLRKSKASNLSKVVALLREHEADLGSFLSSDAKGKQVFSYLAQLSEHLAGEQAAALQELGQLQKNVEHIKDIVSMQQSYAKVSGAAETLQISNLMEDALKMNASGLAREGIRVVKEFENVPPVTVEKHKVLQILVNLVRNARHACGDSGQGEKQLLLRLSNNGDRVRLAVTDNGVGIPQENLARIFSHGFTTKKDGHGFGLHSGALAAREMGGELSVQSDGLGRGATFTLELPVHRDGDIAP